MKGNDNQDNAFKVENQKQENGETPNNETPTEVNNKYKEVDFDDNNLRESNINIKTYNFKIIVLGDLSSGKTFFINRYIYNSLAQEYKTSISCEYKQKKVDIDSQTVANLQIWDTSGEERFMSVTKQYFRKNQGAIVVFNLTDKKSFEQIDKWIKIIKEEAPKNIVIMVIGNKCDLINKRVDFGSELETYKKDYLYFEVSAKNGTNVSLAFEELVLKIIEKEKEKELKGEEDTPRENVSLKKSSKKKKEKKNKC
jgi:small GTP-binding protein